MIKHDFPLTIHVTEVWTSVLYDQYLNVVRLGTHPRQTFRTFCHRSQAGVTEVPLPPILHMMEYE